MKSLRTLTLAATLALIGMAGGYAGDAQAETRPAQAGNLTSQTGHDAVLIGLLLPAVQKAPEGDGAADLVVGAGGGGRPGEANGLIGLLKPADQAGTVGGLPAVQMPTDQKNGDGRADLVTGAGGANGKTWTGPVTLDSTPPVGAAPLNKVGTGTLTLSGNTLGSLNGLGSTRDLFANSRGGDQTAGAHGAGGGGGAGKVVFQDLQTTAKAGDGSVVPTDQFANPSNGGTNLPAVQKVREAAARMPANTGANASGAGGQVAGGGAAKSINFTNTARK